MLKLPFFNRIKPVEINFYTASNIIADLAPPVLSSQVEHPFEHSVIDEEGLPRKTFRTCYSYLKSLKTSVTIPAWCEFSVSVKDGRPRFHFPMDNPVWRNTASDCIINPDNQNDWVSYHRDPNFYDNVFVSKITNPWIAVCKEKPRWIIGQHTLNTSGMCIPTGIIDLKYQHSINIFNYLPKHDFVYHVKAGTPLVSLYPILEPDRPIKVNASYDPDKFLMYCDSADIGRIYKNANLFKCLRAEKKHEEVLIKK